MKTQWTPALLLLAGCTLNPPRPAGKCEAPASPAVAQQESLTVPQLDHHQHLMSEASRRTTVEWLLAVDTSWARQTEKEELVDADRLVQMMDEARMPRALVLSNAYWFSRSATEQTGEYEKVKAENDWILSQVRRHPNRLFAACSVNPRRSHAVEEIERCVASGGFRALKIHFDASGVDVRNPEHVAGVRRTFAAANRLRLPIVAHLQSEAGPYGGEQARIFLNDIMPAAPDVPVTVLHLWGGGLYGKGPAAALSVFAEAVQRKDSVTRNLWFDVAQASMMVPRHADRGELVARMRQIGFARVLYGSDGSMFNGVPPVQHWEEFSACMPLTRAELNAIATNIAPYLR